MDNSEKTYKILKKIAEKISKLIENMDEDLNKILSLVDKCPDFINKTEFRNALKEEFLIELSERIIGKPLIDVV